MDKLLDMYHWLRITTTIEDYVEPSYYDNLLKPYIFAGKSDLDIFKDFLKQDFKRSNTQPKVLELGCGNGRVTKVFLNTIQKYNLDLVDLSSRMMKASKSNFKTYKNIKYFVSDSINYLEKNNKVYDLIFSLWSFSHSVHQILNKYGIEKGNKKIKKTIIKTVQKNMKKGSQIFIIHFDSLSDEQRILIRQWRHVFPIFKRNSIQSPSKLIIDESLNELFEMGLIKYSLKHYIGKPIIYDSIDKALEIFMNFHMESFFNKSVQCPQIINELTAYFQKFKRKNGKIYIKPGCYIYRIKKNI